MTSGDQEITAVRFMWAVQALAASGSEQKQLFPEFVDVTDELALDHEETQAAFFASAQPSLSPQQREALELLDQQLETMSGPENSHLWTDDSLCGAAEWERVRQLAVAVLRVMGWPIEKPPQDRSIYIGPPSG